MSSREQGVVRTISTKEWYDDKKGQNINLYSFQLEGNNRWFRTGTNRPSCNQGDSISFMCNEKGNVDVRSIQKGDQTAALLQGTQARDLQPQRQPVSSGGGQSRDGYWAAKEENDKKKDARYQEQDIPRMSFSASQDRAVNLVAAALEHDCLSFGNMKKGEKLDYLLGCVDEVTDRFLMQSMGAGDRYKQLLNEGSSEAEQPSADTNEFVIGHNDSQDW